MIKYIFEQNGHRYIMIVIPGEVEGIVECMVYPYFLNYSMLRPILQLRSVPTYLVIKTQLQRPGWCWEIPISNVSKRYIWKYLHYMQQSELRSGELITRTENILVLPSFWPNDPKMSTNGVFVSHTMTRSMRVGSGPICRAHLNTHMFWVTYPKFP